MAEIRIGTSGWTYPEWRGGFYPSTLRRGKELEHLSARLNSVEVNGTFYGLRGPHVFRSWRDRTPDDFVLAVKGPKVVTHTLRLRDPGEALAAFLASGVGELGDKLGPLLWQLPPTLAFDRDTVAAFLDLLPPVRHAVEARHPSFGDDRYFDLLRERGVASVVADSAGRFPLFTELTADFAYARLHGPETLYTGDYPPETLRKWAAAIHTWSADLDVYVYLDNTMSGHAPTNAVELSRLVKGEPDAAPDPG
ncbi:DUF72 domain-containing protein [Actinokineospora sp. PR83]|uniref:DUF72 domain-containing protein n=1 Tax=Actinokineospora sp. PR83 TaxID=2884908 RepID=UPI001F1B9F11|nr:DUF72 domain-containing protein [Actinokineospora sp. PR83]MCG8914404.1 DUF72 domain-containing protein [Actinokineospora sp. PR83]